MSFLGSSHPNEQCPSAYQGEPFDVAKATPGIYAALGDIPDQDASLLYAWLQFYPDPDDHDHLVETDCIKVPNNSPYADRILRLSGENSRGFDPIAHNTVQEMGRLICSKIETCRGPVEGGCPALRAAALLEVFLQAGLPAEAVSHAWR